jgi:small subunit ribosomal protein S11
MKEKIEETPKKETKDSTENLSTNTKSTKFNKKEERAGIAYIYSSSNNTIVHITDLAGNTISRISGGMITKHSRLKANPTIAMFVAKRAAERARDLGITDLYIRMKAKTRSPGPGPGSHAAVKTLGKEGFRVVSILETTKVPRGGPLQAGGRRGRRV